MRRHVAVWRARSRFKDMQMRRLAVVIIAAMLAACTPPAPDEAATLAPVEQEETGFFGPLIAVSNTAMSITGDVMVEPGRIVLAKGITLETEALGARDATNDINARGESYAQMAPGPTSLGVELRRVVNEVVTGDTPNGGGLCGAGVTTTYIALVGDTPLTALTLIAFSGAEAPAPEANDSAVCGTFMYQPDETPPPAP
jgi:hypothetical protein